MKKRVRDLFIAGMAMLFCTFSAEAQTSKEILGNIDNPKNYTTFTLAHMDRDISTFINLVALSDLELSLLMADDHTVFIPTNEAFKEMEVNEFLHLTHPDNKADLVKFVKYHFLPNKVMKYDFKNSQAIDTQGAEDISVNVDEPYGTVYIGGARIIKDNIETSDGVIHIVDRVIIPTGGIDFDQESK